MALTEALPVRVNVHVLALLPLLEHAPDQIASRPLETLSVTAVPVANVAVPVLPTATLIPAGLEVTRSPFLPVAVTVNVTDCVGGGVPGGFTPSIAVRLTPPKVPVIVSAVVAVTAVVVTVKVALVVPAATVTLAGTAATAVLALLRLTTAPPVGAALVSVSVPCTELPPTTEVGVTFTVDKLTAGAVGGAACAVKRRVAENGPPTPAELMARTRQKSCWAGKPLIVACDALTVWLNVIDVKVFEVETWTR